MVEESDHNVSSNSESAEECLLIAQDLVPAALERAKEVKGFSGKWKIIISKLDQIPSRLSDLSSHPFFSKNTLCIEQLQAVSKTLNEAIRLAKLCLEEKFEGKLQMQSDLDFDARESDLERLFRKYGKVDRVDLKTGFAFIYMDDERDAKDAIRGLDRIDFGRKRRRLRVEWTKEERGGRRPSNAKRSSGSSRPSKTLFVINFDPYTTRSRDLERHFDPHGKILNVRIRKNFAFIQFETQEDATRALEATDSSKLLDHVISVEYAIKDDDDRRSGASPNRNRDRSPGRVRERSLSPYRRERGSPDYGRSRPSPDYGRRGSPSPLRREKNNNGIGRHSRSPRRSRSHPRSHSPRRERLSPEHDRKRSPGLKESPL